MGLRLNLGFEGFYGLGIGGWGPQLCGSVGLPGGWGLL